ncbi:hypothetical protein ACFL2C_02790 [Patescibacteria group bacterium]
MSTIESKYRWMRLGKNGHLVYTNSTSLVYETPPPEYLAKYYPASVPGSRGVFKPQVVRLGASKHRHEKGRDPVAQSADDGEEYRQWN